MSVPAYAPQSPWLSPPADPPPQLVPTPNVTVSPGETAVLSCQVLGDAPYNLTWVRDWRVLPASMGRITQLANLSLEIRGVVPSDSGRYQCMASNANGATRASTWLLVRGKVLPAVTPPFPPSTYPKSPPPILCQGVVPGKQQQPFWGVLKTLSPPHQSLVLGTSSHTHAVCMGRGCCQMGGEEEGGEQLPGARDLGAARSAQAYTMAHPGVPSLQGENLT